LGKLSASFICLALPLVICTIISCIVLALNDMLTFQMDIVRIALFVLFSLIYILFFLLVGLIISISTRRPQESLITGVLCWLVLVFVMPALVPQAAKLFVDLPSARAVQEVRRLGRFGLSFDFANPINSRQEYDARAKQLQDRISSEWEKSRNQFANYAAINRWFAAVSPSDLFGNAGMEIVGNGVQNAFHTKRGILQFRDNILKDPKNTAFVFKRVGFASDLLAALFSMFILCLEIIALLIVAYRKFMLLDLREG
jgi:ABC-type transport system involved in multi-copper enzyme maturation permease subunit